MLLKNGRKISFFKDELRNFQDIAAQIKPSSGEIPTIKGFDIYGEVLPFNGLVGGDHIVYVDFNKRYDLNHRIQDAKQQNRWDIVEKLELNKNRAGILLADVSGHHITDGLLGAMLHQAFLTGVQYELLYQGEVTLNLFEILNTRFFNSSSFSKFITLIYGEIQENGNFTFVNAGHPPPVVFSHKYDRLVDVSVDRVRHFPPIGTLPSSEDIDSRLNITRLGYKKKYTVNQINLMGNGDILLLYTDGLTDQCKDENHHYFPLELEKTLKEMKSRPARDIFARIKADLLHFGKPLDDISCVIIKKL